MLVKALQDKYLGFVRTEFYELSFAVASECTSNWSKEQAIGHHSTEARRKYLTSAM